MNARCTRHSNWARPPFVCCILSRAYAKYRLRDYPPARFIRKLMICRVLMRNPRNATTHFMVLILALGSLICVGSLVSRTASATVISSEPDAALSIPGWNLSSNLNKGRLNHTATLLPNGKVLVAGGEDLGAGVAATSAELYDSTENWNETGNLKTGRYLHTATLLTNGKVVIAGGC